MSNMSYCRFENTLADLKDCEEALDLGRKLSDSEQEAFKEMLEVCERLASNFAHILKQRAGR